MSEYKYLIDSGRGNELHWDDGLQLAFLLGILPVSNRGQLRDYLKNKTNSKHKYLQLTSNRDIAPTLKFARDNEILPLESFDLNNPQVFIISILNKYL